MIPLRSRNIVVTGATGMLGSDLVAQLLVAGCRQIKLPVRSLANISTLRSALRRFNVEDKFESLLLVEMSLSNPDEIKELMTDVNLVFHCAATVSFDPLQDLNIISSNVEITTQIAFACRKANVELLVHVSSIATLGEACKDVLAPNSDSYGVITEGCQLSKLDGRSAYSISKFYSENVIWRESYSGLKVVVINPSIIIGEGNYDLLNLASRGFYTTGVKGYVDVRDVSRAMIQLSQCEKAINQRFIVSSVNLSFKTLFELVAQSSGKPKPKVKFGKFSLNLALSIERLVCLLSGNSPRFSESIISNAIDKSFYCGEKLCETIDFDYTDIEKTIDRVVKDKLN